MIIDDFGPAHKPFITGAPCSGPSPTNVSHDVYGVSPPSPSPGGSWSIPDYEMPESFYTAVDVNPNLSWEGPTGPPPVVGLPIHTEIEYALALASESPGPAYGVVIALHAATGTETRGTRWPTCCGSPTPGTWPVSSG
jgi:hypothetical protein